MNISLNMANIVASYGMWIAAISSAVAIVASLMSGIAANKASEITSQQAEIKIAEANARAEEARLAISKMEAGLAWRNLTSKQISIIKSELSGKLDKITISTVGQDPEAVRYSLQIRDCLTQIGIEVFDYSGWITFEGVAILGDDTPNRQHISDALTKAGIIHRVAPRNEYVGRNRPALVIGSKSERL